MEKEAEFVKQLKGVQIYHVEICILLMRIATIAFGIECLFALYCIVYFGCIMGSCENQLVCFVHYIKFAQTLLVINTYTSNIAEKQPNHPISTLNTFLVILMYYICLYRYISDLKEDIQMVNYCVLYPVIDFILIVISLYAISKVKHESSELIRNKRFKEYN